MRTCCEEQTGGKPPHSLWWAPFPGRQKWIGSRPAQPLALRTPYWGARRKLKRREGKTVRKQRKKWKWRGKLRDKRKIVGKSFQSKISTSQLCFSRDLCYFITQKKRFLCERIRNGPRPTYSAQSLNFRSSSPTQVHTRHWSKPAHKIHTNPHSSTQPIPIHNPTHTPRQSTRWVLSPSNREQKRGEYGADPSEAAGEVHLLVAVLQEMQHLVHEGGRKGVLLLLWR